MSVRYFHVAEPNEPAARAPEQPVFGGEPPRPEYDRKVIAVVVIGALIAFPALLSLLGSAAVSLDGSTGGSSLSVGFDLAYLVLGVGLMMRRELARQVYLVLATIGLIFLGIAILVVIAGGAGHTSLAELLPGLLLTVIPMYFLTRPDVAKLFH